jgi:hypothetical protein
MRYLLSKLGELWHWLGDAAEASYRGQREEDQ